ncbi:MAG: hypothetical protein ABI776_20035 [Nocardioidaceae bacterium]
MGKIAASLAHAAAEVRFAADAWQGLRLDVVDEFIADPATTLVLGFGNR